MAGEDRAPDCATPRAASIAGILAAAVMADEMSLFDRVMPTAVDDRIGATLGDGASYDRLQYATDFREGLRVAHLMISARARASVRTPSHAALSAAEAALALAEDALDAATHSLVIDAAGEAFLASIRDTLRAGLDPLHRADGQAPSDAGPPAA